MPADGSARRRDRGNQEDGGLRCRGRCDRPASSIFPRCATSTAPPCSAIAHIATITPRRELAQPDSLSKNIQRAETSATKAVATVAIPSATSSGATPSIVVARDVQLVVAPQRLPGDDDVDEQEHDRDSDDTTASEWRLASRSIQVSTARGRRRFEASPAQPRELSALAAELRGRATGSRRRYRSVSRARPR